jgi:hypothetical protein
MPGVEPVRGGGHGGISLPPRPRYTALPEARERS